MEVSKAQTNREEYLKLRCTIVDLINYPYEFFTITMHQRLRNLLRCFVPSAGLRDAIRQDRVAEYFDFKHYYKTQFAQDNALDFPAYLAVVATVKNEAPYLAEWIEYHKLVGVDTFYIYDNESTDATPQILEPYIKNGDVVYCRWPGLRQQLTIYNDALRRYRLQAYWLAFIDIDEFMVPLATPSMRELLADYEDEVGLSMHWLFYGDNGQTTMTQAPVIERFTAHAPRPDIWMKTIVNPRAAFAMEAHHGCFIGNRAAVNENHHKVRSKSKERAASKVRLNHYWGKTWEEYQMKRARGQAGQKNAILPADRSLFDAHNHNEVQDDSMAKWIEKLKESGIRNQMSGIRNQNVDGL